MKISIEYEASWRNSFLDGDNNSPLPKTGREYVGSMTTLKKDGNYIERKISLDTVMGILNRLIGDQRKLYQSRERMGAKIYFFENIESKISFEDKPLLTNEMVFVRNMKGSEDQNSFTGMIKGNDPIFNSDYSAKFWGILALDLNDIYEFILGSKEVEKSISLDPLSIISRLEEIDGFKSVPVDAVVERVLNELKKNYPDIEYLENNGTLKPIRFYCSALYLQMQRLSENEKFNLSSAKTKAGGISGISKRGFTKKDFMVRYTTGDKKILWGNPYMKKEKIKGQGEVTSMLTKASGRLEINIDVEKEKAQEIKDLIDNAGVSAFYLGKKGLAYVSKIRI